MIFFGNALSILKGSQILFFVAFQFVELKF